MSHNVQVGFSLVVDLEEEREEEKENEGGLPGCRQRQERVIVAPARGERRSGL
eukprot:CAMPEP_0114434054 /NCGR_PEP_ID=MMETSP0103-20121206/12040_1 /TAXON_ID=37642 ORGANISM="Paraphysomonas imperforata, Strain PA2" /NCGR_SAMPLE_ID=MMETSP0103 /ASSEMBLY_ACC=CAM_ASM_000201 /LENGTH=52 /DNA_ID=CAMNT_0001603883 /DNA_START=367 /DNA_END=525 /DNA_ORIENTATION=+